MISLSNLLTGVRLGLRPILLLLLHHFIHTA